MPQWDSRFCVVGAALVVAVSVVSVTPDCTALPEDAHTSISTRALKDADLVDYVMTPTPRELVSFFRWFTFAMAKGGDEDLQQRFQKLYPDPGDFDALGARRFLGMSVSGGANVWAVTRVPEGNAEQRLSVIARASTFPTADKRYRDQVHHTDTGHVQFFGGEPEPYDPATLRFGPLLESGSDLWAQDTLALAAPDAVTELADPDPSWREPFIDSAPINFAAALAETSLSMAILSRTWGDVENQIVGEYMASIWLGCAMHFAQNAASPLAAVETGGPAMRSLARRAYRKRALMTLGGITGELHSAAWRIRRARRSLQMLGRSWLRGQIESFELHGKAHPLIKAALEAAGSDQGDTAKILSSRLRPWLNTAAFREPHKDGRGGATVLVEALAAISARESGSMYDALTDMSASDVADGTWELLETAHVKDEHWRARDSSAYVDAEQRLAEHYARVISRAATATRLMNALFLNGSSDSAARRVQALRLAYLDAADQRSKAWRKSPHDPFGPIEDPAWAVVPGGAVVLAFVGLLVWWRRKRARS